jgi:PIN domain nuclease of toxin-antitoxin system
VGGHEVTYLLDTSVWFRAALEPLTIPASIQAALEAKDEMFGLSAISLWEIAKKYQLGRISLSKDLLVWLKQATGSHIQILPLTAEVVAEAMRLPEFPNRDPADELIVAAARVHSLTLLTTDSHLKRYPHARISYFKPILT